MQQLEIQKFDLAKDSMSRIKKKEIAKEIKIVAEGDSWFNYPLVLDVIDHLRKMKYCISRQAEPGDTLENMIFGSEYKISRRQNTVTNFGQLDLKETLQDIKSYKPSFVLFSGGGNDIVGDEMRFYINHRLSGKNLIRKAIFTNVVYKVLKPMILDFCYKVWHVDKKIDILMDGYDYAKPNGTSYYRIKGPWLLPNFGTKAIEDRKVQEKIIKYLVDTFNEMLKEIAQENTHFHHIDLRGMFPYDHQWHNEIHLRSNEYKKVALKYHKKMVSILGYDPLKN